MKRKFYKVVKENLLSKKDLFIFTILESVNDLDIGKKILKVDNEFIFEDERDREKYKEIIENLDLKETNKVFDINNSYKIMLEQIASKPKLVICGGGHISLELYKVAKMLDFNVIVIDDDSGTLNLYFNGDVIVSNKGNSIIHSERDVNIVAEDSIIMNQGTNEGMVIIAKLTEKLNQTVKELENLRNLFNTHVHTGVTSGPASTGPTPTQASQPFTQYKQEDYENPKFIH